MGSVIIGMSMSLDGCINDRSGGVDKLYPDFAELQDRIPPHLCDGIASASAQAKAAAGDKNVTVVGGPNTLQQILRAGLADEIHIDILPALLNGGQKCMHGLVRNRSRWKKSTCAKPPTALPCLSGGEVRT